jgi:hypothetical protein
MLSGKPMKGAFDTFLRTHLALPMMVIIPRQLLVFVNAEWDGRLSTQDWPVRPNGPGERSPGLRPQADTLGGEMTTQCGLKGRETAGPVVEGRGCEASRRDSS